MTIPFTQILASDSAEIFMQCLQHHCFIRIVNSWIVVRDCKSRTVEIILLVATPTRANFLSLFFFTICLNIQINFYHFDMTIFILLCKIFPYFHMVFIPFTQILASESAEIFMQYLQHHCFIRIVNPWIAVRDCKSRTVEIILLVARGRPRIIL
jgi:hypothetical protein